MGLGTLVSKIASLGKPVVLPSEVTTSVEHLGSESTIMLKPPENPPSRPNGGSTADGALTADMTMGDLLSRFPSAQRALFQKYHVGGCSSCGYEESETLKDVMANHGVTDMQEVMSFILKSEDGEKQMRVSASDTAQLLKQGSAIKLVDVRDEHERRMAAIDGSVLLTRELAQEMMESWPKDTPIIFHCHHGIRSLDAASYFAGHGFTNVRSMTGGIEAWSAEVDPTVPRY
ncbi:MAG: rhodanese-like domain-containing protein [Nitrospirae bacterium]|nr:rhodanese-like domain-containing protein [Nitrospirota bacterium]